MPINFEEMSLLLQQGRAPALKEKAKEALDAGTSPQEVLEKALLPGMDVIGGKFKENKVFIPEVMLAARAMNGAMDVLKPLMAAGEEGKGTVVIGTVKGDMHDVGKNLCKMMMEGKGLKVIDLGVNVPPEKYIAAALENKARVIACSALLTTTMREMAKVVEAVKEAGLSGQVKVMIGGAPVTQSFCDSIGADCYTPDAASCAEAAYGFCCA